MRVQRAFVIVAIALGSVALADTKSEITACYRKMETALKAKNIDAAMAICSADFKWIDKSGKAMTRSQLIQQMKMQFSAVQKVEQVTNKINKLTTKGDQVITRTSGVFEASLKLTPDAKKSSKLKSVSTTDDTWVKTPMGWLLIQVKAVSETMTLDGKPVGG